MRIKAAKEKAEMAISDHGGVERAMVELAELALKFGRIERTGVGHPDGTPETDSDHTVMLCWIAPAIAEMIDDQLDPSLVAEMAAVHDAAEVHAGDTPTLNITNVGLAAKAAREKEGTDLLVKAFCHRLNRFVWAIRRYEDQELPEARFVRAVDKILPKLVHIVDNGVGALKAGARRDDFRRMCERQRQEMAAYAGEWPDLFIMHIELCEQVLAMDFWGN